MIAADPQVTQVAAPALLIESLVARTFRIPCSGLTPSLFRRRFAIACRHLPAGAWAPSRQGAAEYAALARRHGLGRRYLSIQLAAVTTGKVFVERLKRAGRSLTRENLVAALEELRDFDAGIEPRISFGPNRRTGAVGAYVLGVEPGGQGSAFTARWIVPRD